MVFLLAREVGNATRFSLPSSGGNRRELVASAILADILRAGRASAERICGDGRDETKREGGAP